MNTLAIVFCLSIALAILCNNIPTPPRPTEYKIEFVYDENRALNMKAYANVPEQKYRMDVFMGPYLMQQYFYFGVQHEGYTIMNLMGYYACKKQILSTGEYFEEWQDATYIGKIKSSQGREKNGTHVKQFFARIDNNEPVEVVRDGTIETDVTRMNITVLDLDTFDLPKAAKKCK